MLLRGAVMGARWRLAMVVWIAMAGTGRAAAPEGMTAFLPAVSERRSDVSGLMHPGLGMTKRQLETMQRHVRAGDEPWAQAFDAFRKQGRSALAARLQYQAEWTEILHGPLGKAGNFITFRMAMDADVAFHQVLMWYVTGEEAYRLRAIRAIRNYFSIVKVEPHWDSQIRWGIAMSKFCFVVELLRCSEGNTAASAWTAQDQARFGHLLEMGKPLITGTEYWMNQHGFATMGLMGTAVVLDDRALYEECVERTTVNARGEAGGRNGSIQWQMRLVTENALTGEPVADPQVQLVEMGRDQGHAWLNPAAMALLAQIIDNQGTRVDPVKGTASRDREAVGVFAFLDHRLLAGTEYLQRYSLGEKVRWIPVVMNFGKEKPQIAEAIQGAPRRGTAGILYNHYRYAEKWERTDPRFRGVAEAYEAAMPEPDGGTDFPGNGTLLYTPEAGRRK